MPTIYKILVVGARVDDGGFPGGTVVKNLPANAGGTGSTLVREDPTCRRATKAMHHNYQACALEPTRHNY